MDSAEEFAAVSLVARDAAGGVAGRPFNFEELQ